MPPKRYNGPPKPPVVTRFVPGPVYPSPQTMPAPYQQYPASAPAVQPYAPPQSPFSQQYGPSGAPYAFHQSPQPYSAPPTPQYGNPGYQAPVPNVQFSQPNSSQQFSGPGYQNMPQQFTPTPVQYQQPQTGTPYPLQNSAWNGQAGPQQAPQWNNASSASSFSNPGYQQQNQPPQNAGVPEGSLLNPAFCGG